MRLATEVFNPREIASFIWIVAAVVFVLILARSTSRQVVRSFLQLLKAALGLKTIFLGMLLYVCLMVACFAAVGLWTTSDIKDTVYWTIGVGLILVVNSNKAIRDDGYFRKITIDNLKLALVLEFLVNLYTFSLVWELILSPVVFLLLLVSAFAENNAGQKQLRLWSQRFLGVIGVVIFVLTVRNVAVDVQGFATLDNLRAFLLPVLFFVAFLPLVYLIVLLMAYQIIFLDIEPLNKDRKLIKYAKRRVFFSCHLSLSKLRRCLEA